MVGLFSGPSLWWGLQRDIINIRFDYADCRDCPTRQRCVSSERERALAIRPRPLYEALHDARRHQHTAEFRKQYHARAGIAGTVSQGVSFGDLRRTRYRSLAKTIPTECPALDGGTPARNGHRH